MIKTLNLFQVHLYILFILITVYFSMKIAYNVNYLQIYNYTYNLFECKLHVLSMYSILYFQYSNILSMYSRNPFI